MKHVLALGDLRHAHLLIADGTDIIVLLDLLLGRVLQTVDLPHSGPPLDKGRPALLCLTPDVEVSMDEHHAGSDGSAALEYQDPTTIEEEEDSEEELDSVTEGPGYNEKLLKIL